LGVAHGGFVGDPMNDVQKKPSVAIDFERGPTRSELSTWERLLRNHQNALRENQIAGLALTNASIVYQFAGENAVFLVPFPPELEQKYLDVRSKLGTLTRAIRGVEDLTLGVSFSNGDIDILAPTEESAIEHGFGLIPLVILGVVVLAGAIAAAIWATKNSIEISNQAREIAARADKTLCSDPNSELCKKWKIEKSSTGYNRNVSVLETVKSSLGAVGQGIGSGLAIAIPLLAFWAFGRK